ncbi:MAG: adenylyltransferase/cytidyltransferase family protein, partial [Chthoniobacterales bacterium]
MGRELLGRAFRAASWKTGELSRIVTVLRKIGIYGGTFDPIHHAHLILAREALEQLGLDAVIFIPAAVSPHKLGEEATPAAIR